MLEETNLPQIKVNEKRARNIGRYNRKDGIVLYWMSREQRVHNNWALLYAQQKAQERKVPLVVMFTLVLEYPGANFRHYSFMLKGLKEVEAELRKYNIPLVLLLGHPPELIQNFVLEVNAGLIVTDFDPIRIKQEWKEELKKRVLTEMHEVDAHNIVPCWYVSDKEEYSAATFRRKITPLLETFLEPYPSLQEQMLNPLAHHKIKWDAMIKALELKADISEVNWLIPGEKAAKLIFEEFAINKLKRYNSDRNNPNVDAQSNLSPYLHFGHISAQWVAIELLRSDLPEEEINAFLEQLIVRKELSDNFCYYNKNYDNLKCARSWAITTLKEHSKDEREYNYSLEELENAQTHIELWNAAQSELLKTGKMHGYMRMYWAKKILEWTESPEEALRIANYLNDKYALDGRDPNGYVGCAWSIVGIHDRPWSERPVFGKIRYMNTSGCKRKFDVDRYIKSVGQI